MKKLEDRQKWLQLSIPLSPSLSTGCAECTALGLTGRDEEKSVKDAVTYNTSWKPILNTRQPCTSSKKRERTEVHESSLSIDGRCSSRRMQYQNAFLIHVPLGNSIWAANWREVGTSITRSKARNSSYSTKEPLAPRLSSTRSAISSFYSFWTITVAVAHHSRLKFVTQFLFVFTSANAPSSLLIDSRRHLSLAFKINLSRSHSMHSPCIQPHHFSLNEDRIANMKWKGRLCIHDSPHSRHERRSRVVRNYGQNAY